jgi:predicted membrane metal-binding protein
VLQAAGDLWRDWRAAHRRPIVLRPYVDLHSRWRLAARFLVPLAVGLFCIVYGFFYAITAPYLIVPLVVPIGILGLLAIWALPENNVVPTKGMELAYSALIIGLILWPNYLAHDGAADGLSDGLPAVDEPVHFADLPGAHIRDRERHAAGAAPLHYLYSKRIYHPAVFAQYI